MQLLSDIINELVDTDKTISSPILKAKVFASRIQNRELLNWLNKEVGGYQTSEDLPEYRVYKCHVMGSYINGNMKYTNVSIGTNGLDDNIFKNLNYMNFYQSISSLEQDIAENNSGSLNQELPAELIIHIGDNIRKKGNPFYHLIYARKTLSISAINEILSVVRNKLLDFVLKIDEEFGNITEIKDLRGKSQEIQKIVNKTIIKSSGDGNLINTGEKAKIDSSVTISKGNKIDIRNRLKEVGLTEKDAEDLIRIIDIDNPDLENKRFGEKVNLWIQSMIGKALNGSWQVTVGAAGNILSEIIQQYYGM